jgi:hypothetical protein
MNWRMPLWEFRAPQGVWWGVALVAVGVPGEYYIGARVV